MPEPASASADLARLRIARDEDGVRSGSAFARMAAIGVAAVMVAVGAWVAWDRLLKPLPAVRVFRVPAAAASASKTLDASGYLVPQRRAEVATKVAGVVARVLVEEGDTVAAGQALAELADDAERARFDEAEVGVREAKAMQVSAWKGMDEAKAQVEAAKRAVEEAAAGKPAAAEALEEAAAKREEARRDFERKKKLFESKDIGEGEFETAEATWKAADARWRGAEANVSMADARLKQATANVVTAESGVERMKAAAEGADARASAAESRVKQAKIAVEDMVIRSPIAGRVTARKIHPGEAASPAGVTTGTRGGALFTVADFSTLEAEVDVNESRLQDLRLAQPARIAVDAVPSKRYRGELRQIVPTADRQRAVVKVRVRLLDPDAALMPEMGLRVTFLESASTPTDPSAPQLPREAVVRVDGKSWVWIVADGKAVRREVELGEAKDGQVEVKRGVAGGDLVVVANTVPLSEGMKVKAEEK
ncbi:MAG: HlyD family secretion [Planctomycetota bacterium]|nr:MAG: HlyD family secretion [Planctomycetota bacterium]